jgi:hypothetical protein
MQFRIIGGALGLAIGTSVLNNRLSSQLKGVISSEQFAMLKQSNAAISNFPLNVQDQVRAAFSQSYNLQMKILTTAAGLQILVLGMLWRKEQISLVEKEVK